MPITRNIRPKAMYKLATRARSTELKISVAHSSRGGGVMVEWQFMLLRGSLFRGSLSRHNHSRYRVSIVVTTKSI